MTVLCTAPPAAPVALRYIFRDCSRARWMQGRYRYYNVESSDHRLVSCVYTESHARAARAWGPRGDRSRAVGREASVAARCAQYCLTKSQTVLCCLRRPCVTCSRWPRYPGWPWAHTEPGQSACATPCALASAGEGKWTWGRSSAQHTERYVATRSSGSSQAAAAASGIYRASRPNLDRGQRFWLEAISSSSRAP